MFDGGGLYLLITPTGSKLWRLKYRVAGREKTLSIGPYPDVQLAAYRHRDTGKWIPGARDKRADAKRELAEGKDPSLEQQARAREAKLRHETEAVTTFEGFAEHWVTHEARRMKWSPGYRLEVEQSIERHLSELNRLPLTHISAPIAAGRLRAVERDAPMMAEKVRRRLRAILDFGVEEGLIAGNPLPARRRGPKVERPHYPAVIDRADIGEILRKARASDPAKGIARAHLLVAFTAQRIAEVVGAQWDEFDLETAVWSIPRGRMKVKKNERGPHLVPIPPRLLAELKQWRAADGADAVLVCPAPRDAKKPITPEGCEKHYRDALGLGGRHSPHSWRSTFKSWCADAGKASEVVEAQLDHIIGNKAASAYDRASRLDLRRALMNWYERELLAARDGGDVVPIARGKR
jgi:integrase